MASERFRGLSRESVAAFRGLRVRPGFAAILLITLALGVGAPTAVFSVLHAVVLRPLPYADADRLVTFRIEARHPNRTVVFDALPASAALAWAADSASLDGLALYNDRALTLTTGDGPRRLTGIASTPNLFAVLGAAPAMGRTFDAASRDAREIVLSHETWRRYLGGDPGAVGSSVTLDGERYRITGVMPASFGFPAPDAAFWVPLLIDVGGGRGMLLPAVARLGTGASLAAATAEGQRALAGAGRPRGEQTLSLRTVQQHLLGDTTRVLWILLASIGVVAVIATTNVALLLLVRGAGRTQEMAIRLALGARRAQLARQLFVEAAALALAGGAAGVLVAHLLLRVMVRFAPPEIPRLGEAGLAAPVLAFALALTAASCVVFGVLSAGRTITVDPVRALGATAGESRLAGARTPRRRMSVLAAGELALTMLLLAGASLLLQAFLARVLVDQGFGGSGLAFRVNLPAARYPSPAARLAFHERLLEQLRRVPGIDAAGIITSMPNRQPTGRFDFSTDGLPPLDPFNTQTSEVRMATDGFFESMGVPLRGRSFTADDREGAEAVIIISEALARRKFAGQDPLGRLLHSHAAGTLRIVGIAGNVRPAGGGEPEPAAYFPLRQSPDVLQWLATVNVLVRGPDPGALVPAVRAAVSSLDPEVPTFALRTLDEEVASLVAVPRFVTFVAATFAGAALLLAAVGVYGVMAYSATQRTREIGVRIALGATRAQVLRLVMRDGAALVLSGAGAGLLLSFGASRALGGLLHEVSSIDPTRLVPTALLLAGVGLAAAFLPARRATRVSALAALRHD
jgi:putative ABC transport system permease protein